MQTHRRRPFVLNLLVTGVIGLAYPTALLAQATLENPRPGSFQSGIGVISGWVCEAERIEIVFDDEATKWQAAYGTSRGDTADEEVCNDDGNNGVLFNWMIRARSLPQRLWPVVQLERISAGSRAGRHTTASALWPTAFQRVCWVCEAERIAMMRPLSDCHQPDRHRGGGGVNDDGNNGFGLLFNFLQDVCARAVTALERMWALEDFPEVGTDSIVAWQTSLQNFVIARVDPLASQIRSMDAAGDSISKGVNADDAGMCTNADQEELNWATSVTHSTDFSAAGAEGVFSQAERLEERQGASIQTVSPNSAASGAQMLKDFVAQAESIKTSLSSRPAPRYTTVVLGHNDICGGTLDKSQASCRDRQ